MKTDNQRYTGYIAGGYTEEEDAVFYGKKPYWSHLLLDIFTQKDYGGI